ncbi:isoprenylcysteine carboxylmethyltransferase family protein [Nitrosomonas sp.]|uniref:methyltransferase family protein n=1 Tax=Nitrosomonas sp. TaxID=42353 RepID=UPI0025DE8CEF|nr:isoprenylcysteine carboxylmethyltransferase family protein [Nitrosomonas sp.]
MLALELRIPPVIQVIIIGVAMWGLSSFFPAFNASSIATTAVGAIFILIGIALAALGVLEFRKANTTVDPRVPDKSSQLVETGVYRISRNPMYLGFLLILSGWAFYLMNYMAFVLLPTFVLFMNTYQIKPEEKYMMQKFSKKFKAYAARVRRWI